MIGWSEVNQEVLNIAKEMIEKYHPTLEDARIGFVFRSETSISGGRLLVGKAAKVPSQYQPLNLDLDFLIWIAQDMWIMYDSNQRKALIDHELCHCIWEDEKAKMRGHDFEEFTEIIQRWGLWNQSLMASSPAFERALQLDMGLRTSPRGSVMAVQPEFIQLPVKEEG